MQPNLFDNTKVNNPPSSIDILGKKFIVKVLTEAEADALNVDGLMELDKQLISLRLQVADDYNHDTLLHEVIHSVDEILSIGLRERQVHQLAAGLIAVLKQNKDLTNWLFK